MASCLTCLTVTGQPAIPPTLTAANCRVNFIRNRKVSHVFFIECGPLLTAAVRAQLLGSPSALAATPTYINSGAVITTALSGLWSAGGAARQLNMLRVEPFDFMPPPAEVIGNGCKLMLRDCATTQTLEMMSKVAWDLQAPTATSPQVALYGEQHFALILDAKLKSGNIFAAGLMYCNGDIVYLRNCGTTSATPTPEQYFADITGWVKSGSKTEGNSTDGQVLINLVNSRGFDVTQPVLNLYASGNQQLIDAFSV